MTKGVINGLTVGSLLLIMVFTQRTCMDTVDVHRDTHAMCVHSGACPK